MISAGVIFALDEAGDGVHGPGAVQGDDGGDVLDAPGLESGAHPGDPRALQLEHAGGLAGGEHVEDLGVVLGNVLHPEARLPPAHQPGRVLQHRQVPEAQEIHLQQPQLFQGGHGVLADHALVVFCQGHIFIEGFFRDHHACGVGGGVAGNPLQGPGRVDEGVEPGVVVVKLLQGLAQAQRLVQADILSRGHGHLLGHGVRFPITHVHGPAHVPDGVPGGHGAEGDDLGHMVGAVFLVYIINNLSPAVHAEIDVDIRHAHPLGVQEALKVKAVFHRVHVGDPQAVAHQGTRGAAPAGANGDALALGVGDEIPDDEEIVHKAHAGDGVQLERQLPADFLIPIPVAPGKALPAKALEIAEAVRLPLRKGVAGQVVSPEGEVEIALFRDLLRGGHGLREVWEEGGHLLLALEIEFFPLEAHPPGVIHGFPGLDAQQHVLGPGVGLFQVVGVVGEDQGDARLPAQAPEALGRGELLGDAVVLDFQVEIPGGKGAAEVLRQGLGPGVVPLDQHAGNGSCQAAGQAHKTLGMFFQKWPIDPGLDVKTLQEAAAHQVAEVFVPRLVFDQKDQMSVAPVPVIVPVPAVMGGHIDLAADDGLYPGLFHGLIESHDAVHDAVVRDGDGVLAQGFYLIGNGVDPAGAVQKAVFRVYMKVDKGQGQRPPFV